MDVHCEVVALVDYFPPRNSLVEIWFKKGEIITITQEAQRGWIRGTTSGRDGWFPSCFVEPATHEYAAIKSNSSIQSGCDVKALFDFSMPDEAGILSFAKGDIFRFIELDRSGSGWAKGKKDDGTRGWFPFDHVIGYAKPLTVVQQQVESEPVTKEVAEGSTVVKPKKKGLMDVWNEAINPEEAKRQALSAKDATKSWPVKDESGKNCVLRLMREGLFLLSDDKKKVLHTCGWAQVRSIAAKTQSGIVIVKWKKSGSLVTDTFSTSQASAIQQKFKDIIAVLVEEKKAQKAKALEKIG